MIKQKQVHESLRLRYTKLTNGVTSLQNIAHEIERKLTGRSRLVQSRVLWEPVSHSVS